MSSDVLDRQTVARRCNAAVARAAKTEIANGRYELFVDLRRFRTVKQTAWDLDISERQAWRYEARRKAEQCQPTPPDQEGISSD